MEQWNKRGNDGSGFSRDWNADEERVETVRTVRFPYKAVMHKKRGIGTVGRKFPESGWLDELWRTRSVEQNLRRRRV